MAGKPGRPADDVEKIIVNLKFYLKVGQDDDLIDFFKRLAPRQRASATIAALRAGGMTNVFEAFEQEDQEWEECTNAFVM